jgi:PAS domain S-box-containing protein
VDEDQASDRRAAIRSARRFAAVIVLLLLAGAIAVYLVLRFVAEERQRDVQAWQVRLGIIADSRFAAVNSWLADQQAELVGLAENASLQLYMSQLAAAASDAERQFLADTQGQFLRNLLIVTAERTGFQAPAAMPEVRANVERVGVAGLALVDRQGRVITATPGTPVVEGGLADFLAGTQPGRIGVMDMFLNGAGRPAMAFAAPVFAVQEDPGEASQIGFVLGVKEIGDDLFALLRQPGETVVSAEAVLVRRAGAAIEYLSPLADGTPPLALKMAADTPDLDAAYALENPGGFAQRLDYRGNEVLVAARGFVGVPWTLVYKVDRAEALADSDARGTRLLTVLLLALAATAVVIVAVWRHGSSRRAAEAARRYRVLAERFETQRNLLGLVTDSQPTRIYILDAEGRYRFANVQVAHAAGIEAADLVGKPMAAVMGPDAAKRTLALNKQALEAKEQVIDVARIEADGRTTIIQSDHIPVGADSGMPPGVLVVESDITEAVTERERRARTLQHLVGALVGVVDQRDPFAADHSARVAEAARAVALEMGLTASEIDTAETAGRLLNLGKILVPAEMLTRDAPLSEEERRRVRAGLLASAELLKDVEFDGPVVETLRQAQAHWDGTGLPQGLAGEEILLSARVVAVANAFVGMISRRAHRQPLDLEDAVATLMREAGRAYDRRAVVALVSHLDNRGGRQYWSEVRAAAAH